MNSCLKLLAICVLGQLGLHAEVRYTVVPIYPPPGIEAFGVSGMGINESGDVVGSFGYFYPDGQSQTRRAYTFTGGSNAVELKWERWAGSLAVGINNSGQIALYGSPPQPAEVEAARYTPGVGFEPLGDFGGSQTESEAINAVGQVTGFSEGTDGRIYAFRYTDSIGLENIGALAGFTNASRGFALNDQGWVAGYGDGYAFVYRNERGVERIERGRAYGINNAGSVVGVSWREPGERGLIYKDGRIILVGPNWTSLSDINNYDVVVGVGVHDGHTYLPLIWSEAEGLVDLRMLIPPDNGWWLGSAAAINDHGQITGVAQLNGEPVAYRLDPIPPSLSIEHSPSNLLVSWSPAWPGLVLESTDSLAGPDWQPVESSGTNVVNVPPGSAQRFFRLNLEGARGLCWGP